MLPKSSHAIALKAHVLHVSANQIEGRGGVAVTLLSYNQGVVGVNLTLATASC